jgi:hypothetical protein
MCWNIHICFGVSKQSMITAARMCNLQCACVGIERGTHAEIRVFHNGWPEFMEKAKEHIITQISNFWKQCLIYVKFIRI